MNKPLVKAILEKAPAYKWSLQGFGMLRLHLADDFRLNVWDSRFRVQNVSLMHTHPWNFTSLIVAGKLRNDRFVPYIGGTEFNHALIKPGPGGGIREDKGIVVLRQQAHEFYSEGVTYQQAWSEIHISSPEDGTVTLNQRRRVGDDIAYVFWPKGEQWVSAEPRAATAEEVQDITGASLERWF